MRAVNVRLGYRDLPDEVVMRGYCEREGAERIGFGECRGIIQPAQ